MGVSGIQQGRVGTHRRGQGGAEGWTIECWGVFLLAAGQVIRPQLGQDEGCGQKPVGGFWLNKRGRIGAKPGLCRTRPRMGPRRAQQSLSGVRSRRGSGNSQGELGHNQERGRGVSTKEKGLQGNLCRNFLGLKVEYGGQARKMGSWRQDTQSTAGRCETPCCA